MGRCRNGGWIEKNEEGRERGEMRKRAIASSCTAVYRLPYLLTSGCSPSLHPSLLPFPSFRDFMGRLDDFVEGRKFPFTLELHDPLGNSFISFHGTR